MKILIIAATPFEIKPLLTELGSKTGKSNVFSIQATNNQVDLLITGIGPIFTSFELSRHLCYETYDLVANVGICGAFTDQFEIGELLEITQDQFGDLGIDDNGSFKTLFEMGFIDDSTPPFTNGKLGSSAQFGTGLRRATAITVSKTNGSSAQIEAAKRKFATDTESMEGAACFYVCRQMGIPCIQVRAVSNYVEPRDASKWNIPLAIGNLNKYIVDWLGKVSG